MDISLGLHLLLYILLTTQTIPSMKSTCGRKKGKGISSQLDRVENQYYSIMFPSMLTI